MASNHPSVSDWILDFLWPCRCAFCGEIISPPFRCCKKCADEFALCPSFPVAGLDAVFAFTDYSHRVAHAVHLLKFQNQPQLAALFAQLIDSRLHQQILDHSPDCLCFVAMYPKKEKQRGYNQAELIARELSQSLSLPCYSLLKKTASTAAQHTLSAEQRKSNLNGVYAAALPQQIEGKRILLIDDVITTGSTMTECAKVLTEHGAVWVGGICFAHPLV